MQLFFNLYIAFVFLTAVHTSNAAATGCGQEVLVGCAQSLSILSGNKELGFATKIEELDRICPNLNEGLRCIDNYTRSCMGHSQRAHFNQLYSGTSMVIQEICQPGPYQREFLKHAPCMQEVNADYEECARDYQDKIQTLMSPDNNSQRSEFNVKRLCCSFQEYMKCSHAIVNDTCGAETALFTKRFLDRMSDSLIQTHCNRYSLDSEECDLELSSGTVLRLSNVLLFLGVLVSVLVVLRT